MTQALRNIMFTSIKYAKLGNPGQRFVFIHINWHPATNRRHPHRLELRITNSGPEIPGVCIIYILM